MYVQSLRWIYFVITTSSADIIIDWYEERQIFLFLYIGPAERRNDPDIVGPVSIFPNTEIWVLFIDRSLW